AHSLDLAEDLLDLRGEEARAVEEDEIVGPAGDSGHSGESSATRTRLRVDGGDVTGPVADQREPFLGDRGQDEFALAAGLDGLKRLRIDDLDDEMILVDVQPVAEVAFAGHSGSHDRGQPI